MIISDYSDICVQDGVDSDICIVVMNLTYDHQWLLWYLCTGLVITLISVYRPGVDSDICVQAWCWLWYLCTGLVLTLISVYWFVDSDISVHVMNWWWLWLVMHGISEYSGSDSFICVLMITLIFGYFWWLSWLSSLLTGDNSDIWILVKTLISCTGYKEKKLHTDFRIVERRTTWQTNKEQPNGVNKKD